jgi:putative membrane protein
MSSPPKELKAPNLSDYLAAERTFLAWIRTGIAFMGFGFVVARFGLFLERLALIEPAERGSQQGFSIWFGTAMIAMGVATNCFSTWHHVRLIRRLNQGETSFAKPSALAIITALTLAAVGIGLAIYLMSVAHETRA